MTEVKIPEQVAFRYKFKEDLQWQHTNASFTIHPNAICESLITIEQAKQYGDDRAREALEMAAKEAERMIMYPGGLQEAPAHNIVWQAASAIRLLKEQIK